MAKQIMSKTMLAKDPATRLFMKDTLIQGRPAKIECVNLLGQTYSVERRGIAVLGLEDDWYEDVRDPAAAIAAIQASPDIKVDLFTFWQRVPDVEPRYPYYCESVDIAVLPITSYKHWWDKQIKSRTRSLIRKAEKEGVVVRETVYDDAFVKGMTSIFNEAPVRQGRPFWHYGKDIDTVRQQFSRYVHREHMIGAYYRDEIIGLIMLGNAGRFGLTGQIISSLKHRDKAINNALVAKAVEVCEGLGLEYLVYLFWSEDSLSEFKRRCGFELMRAPRYFVPLTMKGRLYLHTGLHRGWSAIVPQRVKAPLKRLRAAWYER
jgi:hypothetical protein